MNRPIKSRQQAANTTGRITVKNGVGENFLDNSPQALVSEAEIYLPESSNGPKTVCGGKAVAELGKMA